MAKEILPYFLMLFGLIFTLGGPRGYFILEPYINYFGVILFITGFIIFIVHII
jgi:hypothetical protein